MDGADVNTVAVDEASVALREIFPETPLQLNEHLSRRYGADVWLKREDLSPVRSYKIRGAFNFLRKVMATGGKAAPSSAPPPAITPRASPSSAATSRCRASSSCR
tara:strand:- start:938 stop:1252 length:315 start_codon:yes stop_codon:yes gene_type:complete